MTVLENLFIGKELKSSLGFFKNEGNESVGKRTV